MNKFKLTAIAAFYLSAAHLLPAHSSDGSDAAELCNTNCKISYLDALWRCQQDISGNDPEYCKQTVTKRFQVCKEGCPTGISCDDATLDDVEKLGDKEPGDLADEGKIRPVFEGGMLTALGNESSELDFKVHQHNKNPVLDDLKEAGKIDTKGGSRINNNGYHWSFSGNFSNGWQMDTPSFLAFIGKGITEMSGNNTYKGKTVVKEGTLRLGSPTGIPNQSETTIESDVDKGTFGTLDLNDLEDVSINTLTLAGGTLQKSGDGEASLARGFSLTSDSTIDVSKQGASLSIDGAITGSAGFTKIGDGVLELTAQNSYKGETVVAGGTLRLGSPTDIPYQSPTTVESDVDKGTFGTLDLNDLEDVSINTLTLAGGTLQKSGDGEASLARGFSLTSDSTIDVSKQGASLSIDGAITGSAGFTKIGAGVLELTAENNYTGNTIISGGQLTVKEGGSLSDETRVVVKKDAYYNVYSSDTVGSIAGAGNIEIAKFETLSAGKFDSEFSGEIYGDDGNFSKVGGGTTIFSGKNSYKGETAVKEGTLRLGSPTGIPNISSTRVDSGATLDLNDQQDISIDSLTLKSGTLQNSGDGKASLAKGFSLASDSTIDVSKQGASLSIDGAITGSAGFNKIGAGVLELTAENSYKGETVVAGGTLKLGSATGIPKGSKTTIEKDGTLDLNGQKDVEITSLTLDRGTLRSSSRRGHTTSELTSDLTLKGNAEIHVAADSFLSIKGNVQGGGGFRKTGKSNLSLMGENTYSGDTHIQEGALVVGGQLSDKNRVIVDLGGRYVVDTTDEIGSIEGSGGITLGQGGKAIILTAGSLNTDTTWSGTMERPAGGFTKVGYGTTTFSGVNIYRGPTTIEDGVLALANAQGIDQESETFVKGRGRLDLASNSIGRGEFKINRLDITEGGQVFISPVQPLVSQSIELNAYEADAVLPGGIATVLNRKNNPPIRVSDEFEFESGSLVVGIPQELQNIDLDDDGKAVYEIIAGNVDGAEKLAKNTFIVVQGQKGGGAYKFEGLGEENAVTGMGAVYEGYLEEGSLDLVVQVNDNLECLLDPDSCKEEGTEKPPVIPPFQPPTCEGDDCSVGNELPIVDGDGDGLPDVIDPEPEKPCEGDECDVSNELPDTDGDGEPDAIDEDDDNDGIPDENDPDADGDGELDALPGCEVGDDLCDVISDIPGDEDEAWDEEEEVAGEIIDALLDGLENEEIDLPLSFDFGQLSRLVGSGLAPRNVDAAGRGLALHNNLLVDTLFDRQPLRQFEELVAEEVVEESVVEDEAVMEEAAPVQPLWLKADELSDGEAAEYVEGAVEGVEVAEVEVDDAAGNGDAAVAIEVEEGAVVVEFDGVSLVDLNDDELDLAKRDGVSAWVKGFGGNSRADESSILYNDYDLSAYGTSFGVDVALSETFQIGAYANYGDLNVNQHSGETGGGSWNPEGWGGGLTAQYSTRHFYVQGLLGASEFSGEQSRNILRINEDLGGNTAKGDKSVTSYLGALRIGAPFKTGGVVLEPQGQVVWTRNHEQGFSESHGTEKNLRLKYKSRTTNFAETELGMKLSVPIRTGERGLLVPSLRAAWLADWNQANEGQEIGYKFTNKTVNFDSQLGTENGALLEAGLDYTVQNVNGISVKLYGRGGMEFWASDRGTTWRASGGVTFQF
ncbi:autotransporter outer membrane beta-barrel domain-containing protein [Synechococcus sp. UW69]|uniref:autotransporter outer membrane beta-barrel domain-containing protein n=1 Tax=Synechococcus sp. UW69 TaxID=368493 RepID=UPI000E0ED966|nr:autotransporter outer membrane beta-barrel domain-containing protein [Synechococcus sp. UW69]